MCIGPRMTTGFCWSSRPTSCRPWPRESDARICCPMRGSATRRTEWQIRPRGRKFWTWRSAHSRWHIGRCLRVNPHPLRRRARHSLPSGRYSLLRPDLHRLDRTSLRLAHLFDHLVGAQKEGLRNVEAERFGGRQVDDQLELGRLLDRNVGGLRPLEDLVNKVARAPEHIRVVYAIGDEASRSEILTEGVNRGQSRAERQGVDTSMVGIYQRVGTHIKRLRPALERLEGGHDIPRVPYFEHVDVQAIPAGEVERGERKRTADELSKAA